MLEGKLSPNFGWRFLNMNFHEQRKLRLDVEALEKSACVLMHVRASGDSPVSWR